MIFSIIGLTTTFYTFAIFIKYKNTPVVKSSTRELCYIILVGMTLSHVSVFCIIRKPTKFTCTVNRLLPGISFAMIYSGLLTKTNRIARILADNSKLRIQKHKPRFMSATSQVIITCFIIGIEIFISTWMLQLIPPTVKRSHEDNVTFLSCYVANDSFKGIEGLLVPLSFDFFLIVLCTLYAYKTRNVPENFNEAKFIGFSMYTTCVLWIAFLTIFLSSKDKLIQIFAMSMCVTLSALVIWFFIFIPKLFIILLHPEQNDRSAYTTNKEIRYLFFCLQQSKLILMNNTCA